MLEVQQICKSYSGQKVLENVSFLVEQGTCLGIAGHNGSGKSTLLGIVAGVSTADKGNVLLQGQPLHANSRTLRRQMGYVPQDSALMDDLSVEDNLRFWQSVYGLKQELFAKESSLGALLGLDAMRKKQTGKLSGGMKKRVSIAVALMHRPTVILMDEAFAALDAQTKKNLTAYLLEQKRQGVALLYCSHEPAELWELCDNVLVLRQGCTVYHAPKSNLPKTKGELADFLYSYF